MNKLATIVFATGLAAAVPGGVLAESHPAQSNHPPATASHAAPMRAPATHSGMPGAVHHPVHHRTVAVHRANHPVATHHRLTRHPVAVHRSHVVRHVAHRLTHRAPRIAALRKNIIAAHRFHAGVYRAPPGYRYRRWGFGQFLPSIYWGRDFWIADFLAFGLFAPPDGLVWVRYGPDALLIDEYTGEIIQVDYGVFF